MQIITQHWHEIWAAYVLTIELSVLGFVGALIWGTVLAVFRISPIAPLRGFGLAYVEIVRSIPLLVILVLIVFALPEAGLKLSFFFSVVAGLAGYTACYVCEAVRSGILSVPRGHLEAGRSIGLTFAQNLRFVVLPQALRAMVQPLGTIFIGTVLSSALAAAVGVTELTGVTQQLDINYAAPIVTFGSAAIGYLILTLGIGALSGVTERKVRITR